MRPTIYLRIIRHFCSLLCACFIFVDIRYYSSSRRVRREGSPGGAKKRLLCFRIMLLDEYSATRSLPRFCLQLLTLVSMLLGYSKAEFCQNSASTRDQARPATSRFSATSTSEKWLGFGVHMLASWDMFVWCHVAIPYLRLLRQTVEGGHSYDRTRWQAEATTLQSRLVNVLRKWPRQFYVLFARMSVGFGRFPGFSYRQ